MVTGREDLLISDFYVTLGDNFSCCVSFRVTLHRNFISVEKPDLNIFLVITDCLGIADKDRCTVLIISLHSICGAGDLFFWHF